MFKRNDRWSLPLLMKELQEQSARLRTFVLRVVYAILLFMLVGMMNANQLFQLNRGISTPSSMLGVGRDLFESILWLQFFGVYLFLPAMVCGVLTVEKERNTLGLLLITKLSPWTIILEKFFSRIVPMLTFILISLPAIGLTYALGGLEARMLIIGLWFLGLSVLQVASLAMIATSFFRGTVGAFLGTYFLIGIVSLGLPIIDNLLTDRALHSFAISIARYITPTLFDTNGSYSYLVGDIVLNMFSPPALLGINVIAASLFDGIRIRTTTSPFDTGLYWMAFLTGVPTLICTICSLALARYFLIRRAFVSASNPFLRLFKFMDRIFHSANQRFTGGVMLVNESQSLPQFQPVAWREASKRSFGQFRYLVRIFITLEFPTLFLVLLIATGGGSRASSEPVSALMFVLWIISTVFIAATASTLISGERSRQTLDVLLTSPMSSSSIILEKLAGVRRLMFVCSIPLLTCIAFQTWWRPQLPHENQNYYDLNGNWVKYEFDLPEYVVTNVVTLVVLLHCVMWLAFWIGMHRKSPSKAILSALASLLAWCSVPLLVISACFMWHEVNYPVYSGVRGESYLESQFIWFLSSPAFLPVFTELSSLRRVSSIPYLPVIWNTLIYGSFWFFLRRAVIKQADRGLSRIPAFQSRSQSTAVLIQTDTSSASIPKRASAATSKTTAGMHETSRGGD